MDSATVRCALFCKRTVSGEGPVMVDIPNDSAQTKKEKMEVMSRLK
jgi:hypothetical protein